jgi:hypothetical protein
VDTAVVELDPLADAVRAGPEHDDRGTVVVVALALGLERRVVVGRERRELGAARVDRVVGRPHAERAAAAADGALVGAGHDGQVAVGEPGPAGAPHALGVERRERPARGLAGAGQLAELADEPGVDAGRRRDLLGSGAGGQRPQQHVVAVGGRRPQPLQGV